MRYWSRSLGGNKSTEGPSSLVFFDTETLPHDIESCPTAKLHKLRLGVAQYVRLEKGVETRRKDLLFHTAKEFHDWIRYRQSPHRPLYVFAHNLAFDATVVKLWHHIERGDYRLQSLCAESPPTIIRTTNCKGLITWIDTLNYFPMSLAELAWAFGTEKLPMPHFTDADIRWESYCANDVDIIRTVIVSLLRWLREHDMGVFRSTSAGIAMQSFKHRFNTHDIKPHGLSYISDLESDAYVNGPVLCRYSGIVMTARDGLLDKVQYIRGKTQFIECGPIYHLDVNSMYPYIMREHDLPTELVAFGGSLSPKALTDLCLKYGCIATVLLHAPYETYPVKLKRGVYVANGKFWTSLCADELRQACMRGRVVQCAQYACYNTDYCLRRFVDTLWEIKSAARKSGNAAYETLCKAIMRSLYGKWAQKAFKWVERRDIMHPEPWDFWPAIHAPTNTLRNYRCLAWLVQEEQPKGYARHAFVAISAFVTSYARLYLQSLIATAGERNVYYAAYDSMHVSQEGYDKLCEAGYYHQTDIGKLKIVGVHDHAVYRGVNNYQLDGKEHIAGLSSKAVRSGEGAWTQQKFDTLQGILSGRPADGVAVREVTVEKYRVNYGGLRGQDGWVIPFNLRAEKYHA